MANVEKVVNPPQKPTARNIFHPEVRSELLSDSPYISPIRKHPLIFTKKVPHGNTTGKCSYIKREAKNRDILPRNPPVPTSSNVLIIICRAILFLSYSENYPGEIIILLLLISVSVDGLRK